MSDPTVSIIIVNWNGESFLHDCFASLKEQTFTDFQIIFVDNGSSDGSIAEANRISVELDLNITIVELSNNTGFTGGNIEGLRHCSGKYIALLNNDTAVTETWLEALVRVMDTHPEVGICASKLIVDGTDIIDSAGDGYATFGRAFKRGEGFPASLYEKEEYVFGACAGAALYRRRMIDEIGFMDDDFFLYFEDADLNFRAQLAGWKCMYVPDAVVRHKVNASSRALGPLTSFYGVRNDKIVKIKNLPFILFLWYLPWILLNELISLQYHVRIGRFGSYMKGNWAFFRDLPKYLEKRRHPTSLKKVTTTYIRSLFTSGFSVYLGIHLYRAKKTLGIGSRS